jgi:hypothetical protein
LVHERFGPGDGHNELPEIVGAGASNHLGERGFGCPVIIVFTTGDQSMKTCLYSGKVFRM